jgi:hypothetical protein
MYDKRVNQEFVMEKASPLRFVFLGPALEPRGPQSRRRLHSETVSSERSLYMACAQLRIAQLVPKPSPVNIPCS